MFQGSAQSSTSPESPAQNAAPLLRISDSLGLEGGLEFVFLASFLEVLLVREHTLRIIAGDNFLDLVVLS